MCRQDVIALFDSVTACIDRDRLDLLTSTTSFMLPLFVTSGGFAKPLWCLVR